MISLETLYAVFSSAELMLYAFFLLSNSDGEEGYCQSLIHRSCVCFLGIAVHFLYSRTAKLAAPKRSTNSKDFTAGEAPENWLTNAAS